MRDKLKIVNFKCFKEQVFELPNLTVLVGANGLGKSTVIQSLLLIRSAKENADNTEKVALNGPYGLELGTSASVINQEVGGILMSFFVHNEANELVFELDLEGSNEEEMLEMNRKFICIGSHEGLMSDEFYYLSAERNGPRVSQRVVPQSFKNTGFMGEHTGQLFSKKIQKFDNERKHPKGTTPYLIDHINAWLGEILPGVEVTAEENTSMQTCQVRIRNKRSMDFVESTNIGFGISYALPIIVQGLVAKKGRYFVVENPEAHLHPSAQTGMGKFLAMLADKGLHVVIETHSDHLLDGVQIYTTTHPEMREDVVIYNFGLNGDNNLVINPIQMDEDFDYTMWPQGFMDQTNKNYVEFINSKSK